MISGLEEDQEFNKILVPLHLVGHLGTLEEVAELAICLNSEQASFVIDGYYAVDGGSLVQ